MGVNHFFEEAQCFEDISWHFFILSSKLQKVVKNYSSVSCVYNTAELDMSITSIDLL